MRFGCLSHFLPIFKFCFHLNKNIESYSSVGVENIANASGRLYE